jgi:V8-like Glu-specific endopeptidase
MRWQHVSAGLVIIFGLHLSAAVAMPLRPDVIYGDDDRQEYYLASSDWKLKADSTVALIRASSLDMQGAITSIKTVSYGKSLGLCATEPFYDQETAAFCSGFLIAPDVIVTAGHCIRTQANCDSTNFVFGFRFDAPEAQPRSVSTDHVFKCTQLIFSVASPAGEDFAIAKIDRPVTFVQPLTYRTSGAAAIGQALRVIGHPAGLPVKLAGNAVVRADFPEYLQANLDTYGGNSGSAVFNENTGEVEGVLVRGEMDYLYQNGCRVSNRCEADKCRGEDVTKIERVLSHLPN